MKQSMNGTVNAVLLAIRRHARRVQNNKSHFTVDQHMDAIIALANLGLKAKRQKNTKTI
jgi:hypothetical protein